MLDLKRWVKPVGTTKGYRVAGGKGLGVGREQIETFYHSLGEGLRVLENSLPPDSLSFRVEWLVSAVDFLHDVMTSTFAIVERLFLEGWETKMSLSKAPVDIMNEYLDVSMKLLDMCNSLKDGLSQVEMYHWSLEHAFEKLKSATGNLEKQNSGKFGSGGDDYANYLKPLEEAGKQLDKLQSSKSSTASSTPNRDLLSPRSMHFSTGLLFKSKNRDVSVLLYDVQLVTRFVSCFLLWVLTGESGEDIAVNAEALEASSKLKRTTSWSTFMFRLREKVSANFCNLESSGVQMKLQDVKNFQCSLSSLRAQLKEGLSTGKLAPGSAFVGKINSLLEQEERKLRELSGSLSKVSSELSDMYTEITERRNKVLEKLELSLYHQASV